MLKAASENIQANVYIHMCVMLCDMSLIYMYVSVIRTVQRCAYSVVYKCH